MKDLKNKKIINSRNRKIINKILEELCKKSGYNISLFHVEIELKDGTLFFVSDR